MSSLPIAALAPIVVVGVAFVGYCLFDIVRQPQTRHLPKPVWALISIVSIPLGGIVYLLVGRTFRPVDAGRP